MDREPTKIRPGAFHASVYNEGLCAFLCDADNEAEIERILEESQEGFPTPNSDESEALRPLAERGLLLTYELYQDDELSIQIVVGEPATEEERRTVPMLSPLQGYLSLPSGRLLVHSSNTAPWSDPTDEGAHATVQVPAGEYLASIHHVDPDRLPDAGGVGEPRLTGQLICLSAIDRKPEGVPSVFIRYPGS